MAMSKAPSSRVSRGRSAVSRRPDLDPGKLLGFDREGDALWGVALADAARRVGNGGPGTAKPAGTPKPVGIDKPDGATKDGDQSEDA